MLRPSDLDPKSVRLQAARRARAETERDFVAREVERRMIERLALIRAQPSVILDVGCGRAVAHRALAGVYPGARYLGIELSADALRRGLPIASAARWGAGLLRRWLGRTPDAATPVPDLIAADAHRLPIVSDRVDLVWSNLAWHGFVDPLRVIDEWQRVVRPGGLLMLSALGVDTLRDWLPPGSGLVSFPDMHDIGDALVHAGFAEPVMDAETITLGYRDPRDLIDEMRALLGGNPQVGRFRGLMSRARHTAWLRELESRRDGDGLIPVRLEIIQGHAWCPSPKRLPAGLAPLRFVPKTRPPAS